MNNIFWFAFWFALIGLVVSVGFCVRVKKIDNTHEPMFGNKTMTLKSGQKYWVMNGEIYEDISLPVRPAPNN